MIVVDSTVWIDFFNGVVKWQTDRLDKLLNADEVLMGDLIFTEVLQGFRDDADFATARSALAALPMENMVGPDIVARRPGFRTACETLRLTRGSSIIGAIAGVK